MHSVHQLSPISNNKHKIPLYILTGFLGSGKTTLLNGLLQQDSILETAIIVNEFGTIPIDHLLIENHDESLAVIAGGCLCCTVRHDLLEALDSLYQRRHKQEIPYFKQIIIETSGIADPAPILRTLQSHPHFILSQVITTVDAIHAQQQLESFDESVQQVALADHILISKIDQVNALKRQDLQQSLRQLNPNASIDSYNFNQQIPDINSLLHAAVIEPVWHAAQAEKKAIAKHRYIQSFCLEYEKRLSWTVLERWIQQMTRLRGRDLLRVKGLVYTEETDLPVLIQGVQHIFQKPVTLTGWPEDKPRTQIVFITRNLSLHLLKQSLDILINSKTPEDTCAAALLFLQGMDNHH